MKLYIIPGACSLAANIALREAALSFELVRVDPNTHQTEGGSDFLAVNPKGYVPALQLENGRILTENVAVLQFIADRNPAAKLAPAAGTWERYRLMEWLSFINSEIHKGFAPLFSPDASEDVRQFTRNRLFKRLDYLETTSPGTHLMGDSFSIVDAYLFTVLGWGSELGMDMSAWPHLGRYHAAISRRPQVVAAIESEA